MDIIDEYVEQKLNGVDYSQIRKELREDGKSDVEIKLLITKIDNKYFAILNQKRNKGISVIADGFIRFVLGAGLLLLGGLWLYFIIKAGGAGILDMLITGGSFSTGFYLYNSGKKMLRLASEKKIKLNNDQDVL